MERVIRRKEWERMGEDEGEDREGTEGKERGERIR